MNAEFDVQAELVLGGLYGLLIADAVGVPYEFSAPTALSALELIDIEPPPGFVRAHPPRSLPATRNRPPPFRPVFEQELERDGH